MSSGPFIIFAFAGLICVTNFCLSFVRPLFFLHVRESDFRFISGVPLVGSLIVVLCLGFVQFPHWIFITGLVFALLDTGGIHWFVGSMAWHSMRGEPELKG